MTHRGFPIRLAIILSIALIFGIITPALAEKYDNSWVSKVISVQGRVMVKRHGETSWQPVRLNDTLFAGDQVRVDANSRSGIVLRNDAVLRLDQNTTLVFTEIEKETTFIFRLLKGAANFFSRKPRSLKIVTPFVNGVVEGTEFLVRVDVDQTRIDLFEGRLLASNPYGELQLTPGQGATAVAGSAPQRRLLVKPRESVQWSLYYPPILAMGPDNTPVALNDALETYYQGRLLGALKELDQINPTERIAAFYSFRAALLLHLGSISQARDDIAQSLTLEPQNSEALALQAVIAVVQNRKEEAMEIAQNAVQINPNSTAAQLALSYAHQAQFDLSRALEAAQTAVERSPENGTARARLAELLISTGQRNRGVDAAINAAELNPHESHAHTILGFAFLTQIKTQRAREAFEKAIDLDSAAPLPRLGLGLTKIREGDLNEGRAEIEIAVGLDPVNALMRSYLGKAYYDEKRGPLDETQLDIAKTLDPNDPTPWYYDAIRKQTLNRPVAALQDLQKSIELNDNRAVYRSRLLLDEDLAARSASLGRIYDDLGFEQLALNEGWKSINTDHSNYSGHRFLADSYNGLRRHEIARASELLQSQLLQPLNLTPLQPQLGETDLLVQEGAGPDTPTFNEFNPLFTRNRIALQASGVVGSNSSHGDEVVISGLQQGLSFSLGQFHYESEGFRENNDQDNDIYNGFIQYAISPSASIQAEYRFRDTERGDLNMNFDPDIFAPNRRLELRRESFRIGGKVDINRSGALIFSLIHGDTRENTKERLEIIDPFFQIFTDINVSTDVEATSGEIQYIKQTSRFNLIAGGGYIDNDQQTNTGTTVTTIFPFPFPSTVEPSLIPRELDASHANGYLYTHLKLKKKATITLGVAYDSYDGETVEEDKFNPKVGITWTPIGAITLRAAWLQTIKRPFAANQTIEPTQVAGFNQFFDDDPGAETERYGVAIDAKLSNRLFGGIELSWRDVDDPNFNLGTGMTTIDKLEELSHRAYLYWTPLNALSMSVEGFKEEFENLNSNPEKLVTYRLPVSMNFYFPYGFFAKTKATYVDQEITTSTVEDDTFWVVDMSLGYRLPRRWGIISIGAKNVFNNSFNFQDVNFSSREPITPLYQPERIIFGQITLSF